MKIFKYDIKILFQNKVIIKMGIRKNLFYFNTYNKLTNFYPIVLENL